MNAIEMMKKYTMGEVTKEQANAFFASVNTSKIGEELTKAEIKAGNVGMLDTGAGVYTKVKVKNGKLVDTNTGDMPAFVFIHGEYHEIARDGETLI